MKVTVTQLSDEPAALEAAFAALAAHVQAAGSRLVLLPEMIFHPWVCYTDQVDDAAWQAAVDAHEEWLPRLAALGADAVLGSRPVLVPEPVENAQHSPNEPGFSGLVPHNDGFVWSKENGASYAHRKYYLPNEGGFWEATWYRRADQPVFQAAQAGEAKVGFMICSDLWFGEHARGYARQGVHLLVNPRATEKASVSKWTAGGRAMAVMAGAYCLSSNRAGQGRGFQWGGGGWVIDPDGEVLATTSDAQPFVTVDVDLARAESAKSTYPRDVRE